MAYGFEIDFTVPDGTQTPGAMGDSTRQQITGAVHAILSGSGYLPGWDWVAQDAGGGGPSDVSQPEEIILSKSTYRIKVALGWNGSIVGQLDTLQVSYSSDSGSSYDVIKGGSTNGLLTFTYSSGAAVAGTWS